MRHSRSRPRGSKPPLSARPIAGSRPRRPRRALEARCGSWHCAADCPGGPSPEPRARTLLRCRNDRSGPSAAPAAPVRGRPELRSRQTHRRWKAPLPPQRFAHNRACRQGLQSTQSSCPDRTLPSRGAKQSTPSFGSAGFVHVFYSSLAARPNGGNAFGCLRLSANSSSAGRGSPPTSAPECPIRVCAVKGGAFQWVQAHPATAPAGSNRSSHGGNEVAEASG